MLKRNITYKDFEGDVRDEIHYFNLTGAELVEMEVSEEQGLEAAIKRIVAAGDKKQLIQEFKKIILASYGEKSEDGRHFMKSDEIRNRFACSAAYSSLFLDLATNEDAGAKFIKGVLPEEFLASLKDQDKPTGLPRIGPKPPLPPSI